VQAHHEAAADEQRLERVHATHGAPALQARGSARGGSTPVSSGARQVGAATHTHTQWGTMTPCRHGARTPLAPTPTQRSAPWTCRLARGTQRARPRSAPARPRKSRARRAPRASCCCSGRCLPRRQRTWPRPARCCRRRLARPPRRCQRSRPPAGVRWRWRARAAGRPRACP
jgi:hypothetical protein